MSLASRSIGGAALAAMALCLLACGGGPGGGGQTVAVPQALWGSWKPLSSAEDQLYVAGNEVRLGSGSSSRTVSVNAASAAFIALSDGSRYTLESDNVLARGSVLYLRASSVAGGLKGMVFDQSRITTNASRTLTGMAGMAGISLVLTNVLNHSQVLTATTGDDGAFVTTAPAIPGDSYSATLPAAQGGATLVISVPEPGGDAGIITKTSLPYNLKVRYAAEGARFYARGVSYPSGELDLAIENQGNEASPAGSWMLERDYVGSLNFQAYGLDFTLPSLGKGESFEPTGNLYVSHPLITEDYVDARLVLRLTPKTQAGAAIATWEDYASIRIYRRPMTIGIMSKGAPVAGLVTLPGQNLSIAFETEPRPAEAADCYKALVEVPFRSAASYLIALSASAGTPVAVSADVDYPSYASALGTTPTQVLGNGSEASAARLGYSQTAVGLVGASGLAFFVTDPAGGQTPTPQPAFHPMGGTFSFSPLTLYMNVPDATGTDISAAVVRYATENADPKTSGLELGRSSSLSLSSSVTYRAYAEKPGWEASETLSQSYAFDLSAPEGAALGEWTEEARVWLPRMGSSLLAFDTGGYRKLLVIGGGSSLSSSSTDVFIKSFGQNWDPGTLAYGGSLLPKARTRQAAVSIELSGTTYLYVLGGYNATETPNFHDETYAAILNKTNFELGSWTEAAALPWAAEEIGACIFQGRIYIAGGQRGDTDRETRVAYATPSTDGSIPAAPLSGSWTTAPSMAAAHSELAAVAADLSALGADPAVAGWLFAMGDFGNSSAVALIERAAIGADGSVGEWSTLTPALPSGAVVEALLARGSRLYVVCRDRVYRLDIDPATGDPAGSEPWSFIPDRPILPERSYPAAALVESADGSEAWLELAGGKSGSAPAANEFVWDDVLESVLAQ